MIYRREIDGLRAVAVVPVILFHAGLTVFSGGYVGVDVFFVISGYLITSILINELEQGNFSIARFYERRARRILPALFFVMACCIPFAWMWMLPSELKDFSQSLVAVVFFASNILFWREEGYFAPAAELKPLLHTWSLAVEEQYYLLFPVFLLLAWRFGRNRVFWSICVIAAVSLAASEWGWRNKPSANFYLAPTRAWELLIGSMCAFWLSGREQRTNDWLSLTGLAMIVFAIFYYDDQTPFPSVYALVPVLGTALIIVFGGTGTWTARLLSTRAFVGIGLISYSAYLWHQPLFAFARIRSIFEPSLYVMSGLAALSLVLAYFSWRYVEKPFRNGPASILQTRRAVFATTASIAAMFVAGGLAGDRADWLEQNPAISNNYLAIEYAKKHRNFGALNDGKQILSDCRFNVANINEDIRLKFSRCYAKHGPGIAVLGDSHAIDLYGMIAGKSNEKFLIGITQGFCRPHTPRAQCQYEAFESYLKTNKSVFRRVFFTQAGFYLMIDESGKKGSREMFSKRNFTDPIVGIKPDPDHIALTAEYLARINAYTPVVWIGPFIEPHIPERIIVKLGCAGSYMFRPGQEMAFVHLDQYIMSYVKRNYSYSYASSVKMYNFKIERDFCTNGRLTFHDGDHLSAAGESLMGSRLANYFEF